MTKSAIFTLFAGLVLVTSVSLISAQTKNTRKTLAVTSVNGEEIFQQYCSSCHGVDGTGHGPAAPAMRYQVPDLTQISKRAGGKFPRERVGAIVEGTETLTGHESREMPLWGPAFHHVGLDQDLGAVRTDNVTRYVESLQK